MTEHRLIKDTFLTLIALIVFGLTNFAFNVVVGRVFGSSYLGIVSTALSTSLIISYIVSTSFPGAVSKYVSEYLGRKEEKKANYVLKISLSYGIILSIILLIGSILLSDSLTQFFNIPKTIFLLSVPLIPLYAFYMILKMAYYGYRNVNAYFKNEIFADLLFFIALGIIAFLHWGDYIYLPYLILYLIFILRALFFFKDRFKVKIRQGGVIQKKFFTFAGISFVGTFSSMAMRNLSIMLSSHYVPSTEVGFLAAAFSISTIFSLFPNAIGRVLMPEFSYSFGKSDLEYLQNLLNKSSNYLSVFITFINSLGIIFAPIIVYIFYGEEYTQSIILLQLLLVTYYPSMVGRPVLSILSGTKYVHIPNLVSVFGLFFAITLWILLIPSWGITGTVCGYLIEAWIAMSFTFFFGVKYFKYNYKILIKNSPWIILILLIFLLLKTPYYFKLLLSVPILIIYLLINKNIILQFIKRFRGTYNFQ